MKSRGVRVLLLILAVAAIAAAAAGVWQIEQRIAAAQSAADAFEANARQIVVSFGHWRAAQQASVAEGQPSEAWMTKAATIAETIGPRLSALRTAAVTAEAQGVLESAIESFAAISQSDARAREYLKMGQRLSASDVIFAETAPALEKAVIGVDTARGQERVAFAVALETLRRGEILTIGAAAGVAFLALLLLVPIPRAGDQGAEADAGEGQPAVPAQRGGLRLPRDLDEGVVSRAQPVAGDRPGPAPAAAPIGTRKDASADPPEGPDLDAVADLCSSLARVQDTRELKGLLERAARALDASGVIVWMPEGPQGTLRPVLAHGYASLALSRMGIIHPAADNATATAFRTKSVVVVPAEVSASGAIVAPLISSEGCSGVMALELGGGVEASPELRAVATIVAAQFATMLTPGAVVQAAPPEAAPERAAAESTSGGQA